MLEMKGRNFLALLAMIGLVLGGLTLVLSCKAASSDDAVTDPPAALSYPSFVVNAVAGLPFTALTPTVGGGAVAAYSVSPALPAGLSLEGKTGAISGTPTAATDPVLHTVTATNAAGSASFQLYSKVYAAAGATITGTVTLPAAVTNRFYSVMVDTDHDGGNGGQVGWAIGLATGSSFTYSIPNVPAGSYMVYVMVYAVSGGSISSMKEPVIGDYVSGDNTIIAVSGTGSFTANRTCAVQTSTTIFRDNFDRTTGLGSNWTTSNLPGSPVTISSNQLSIVQTGTDNPYALYNSVLSDNRLRVTFKATFTAVHELEILFRFDTTSNTGYMAGIGYGNLVIGKFAGPGSPTQIAGASPTFTPSSMTGNTYFFDLQIDGSTITLYLKDSTGTTTLSSVSVTDAAFASGKIGLVSGLSVNGSSLVDDFEIRKYQ